MCVKLKQTDKTILVGMDIDFSHNNLTDSSVKFFAELLKKFQGFKSINMSSLSKFKPKDSGF
jgi:hypothetical protein